MLERLREQTEANKDDTLTLAKSVNQLQTDIKQVTRKLMACLSELSMQQATSIKLSQERNDKEALLQEAYRRIEQGLPPSEAVEREWQRMVNVDARRKKDKEMVKFVSIRSHFSSNFRISRLNLNELLRTYRIGNKRSCTR